MKYKYEYDELQEQQKQLFDIMSTGVNCFVSGEAGTGKSFLLKTFIKESRKKGLKVVVCAPTGIAADNIDGTTIHRAFGYPVGVLNAYGDTKIVKVKIKGTNYVNEKAPIRFLVNEALRDADIIIVDEISSVRMDLFTLLATQIQDTNKKRNINAGVNGTGLIQLIVSGDMFQTGPVSQPNKDEPSVLKQLYPTYSSGYAFESPKWEEMQFNYLNLTKVIRQEDEEFSKKLGELRKGDIRILDWLNERINNTWDGETIVICGTNQEVKDINEQFLNNLSGREYIFREEMKSIPGYELNDGDRRNDEIVRLKVGARVMCLVNDKNDFYHNGSLGVVTRITPTSCFVKFDKVPAEVEVGIYTWHIKNGKDEEIGTIRQIPLKLGYAITVHKVQGQTFDKICLKPDIYFDPAMHYVAVGRCKTLEGIQFYGNKFSNRVTFASGYQRDINLVSYSVLNFANEHNLM